MTDALIGGAIDPTPPPPPPAPDVLEVQGLAGFAAIQPARTEPAVPLPPALQPDVTLTEPVAAALLGALLAYARTEHGIKLAKLEPPYDLWGRAHELAEAIEDDLPDERNVGKVRSAFEGSHNAAHLKAGLVAIYRALVRHHYDETAPVKAPADTIDTTATTAASTATTATDRASK